MGSPKKKSILRSRDKDCKFCGVGFSSERTLAAHMCPKKRRFADKDEPASMLGFRIFQRFFEKTTKSAKPKTTLDFIDSKYYIGFMKFSRYIIAKSPIAPDKFIEYVFDESIPMNKWDTDETFERYLSEHLRKETAQSALDRSITAMDEWATENDTSYVDFYELVSTTEATHLLRNGRISPWVIFASENAEKLMGRINDEQYALLSGIMNVDQWTYVFNKRTDELQFVSAILCEAGI